MLRTVSPRYSPHCNGLWSSSAGVPMMCGVGVRPHVSVVGCGTTSRVDLGIGDHGMGSPPVTRLRPSFEAVAGSVDVDHVAVVE